MRNPPVRRYAALTSLVALLALGVGACSSAGDTESADAGGSQAGMAGETVLRGTVDGVRAGRRVTGPAAQARAIIATGEVSLRTDDVAGARDDVLSLATRRGGEVADERSESDEDGDMEASTLTLRVPSEDFADAMEELEGIGELIATHSRTEDVTTQVIDTGVRVRAQERSIRRIQVLLDRARTIRDIVRIESELTRRQAALDSLRARQSYLADQTSLATIRVDIQRSDAPVAEDDTGFLAGLAAGWSGLRSTTVALATALGAVLPFAGVALLLGWPAWLLLRRLVRRPLPAASPSSSTTE